MDAVQSLIFIIGLKAVLIAFAWIKIRKKRKDEFIERKVLLVTAHPDDECMFFGPTVLNLLKKKCEVYLLCLSSGGYQSNSITRKHELRKSCLALGIPTGNLIVIEHSQLPDHPKVNWNKVKIARIIQKYVQRLSVEIVISFDESGISGHLNHIAVHDGLKYLCEKRLLKDCEVLFLNTVYICQKYLGFLVLDVLLYPWYWWTSEAYFLSTFSDIQTIWKSMMEHKSQFVWFRKLYLIFSRYVYLNTLKKLKVK